MNFLGKCKGCNYALFSTPADVKPAEGFRDVKAGKGAFRVGNEGVFGRCTNGHKFFVLKQVEGTFSKDHQCDSRCLNAKGHTCTCSCGGANHGMGHAVVVTADDILDAAEPVRVYHRTENPHRVAIEVPVQHIGEVGKHIKGTATVTQEADERRPYQFTTDSGAVIVWFVPDFITDPEFALGDRITFRAKVKAHTEFRGVGQTVVTYFEQQEV
jgi:hypothetical protein